MKSRTLLPALWWSALCAAAQGSPPVPDRARAGPPAAAPAAPGPAAAELAAAERAAAELAARVAGALDRARPALLRHLADARAGELALCCLAALHDGLPLDDPVLAEALDRLQRAAIEDTYGLAIRLMVLAELPASPARRELAQRDTAMLLERQTTGGFSYHAHDGWWDLSNTQYAALGLRAAVALGVRVPLRTWQRLYTAVQGMQLEDGAFTYRPGQGRTSAYESMTVAGIAVLEIAAQFLDFDDTTRPFHRRRIDRGWAWLAARARSIGERRTARCYYFHYGLERAAILTAIERVGDVDWYAAGAAMMCDEQLGGGGFWGNDEFHPPAPRGRRGHPVDTAFAVLFLRRRFTRVQAPVTGLRQPRSATLPADADDAAIAAAVAQDAAIGDLLVPDLLHLLRGDVLARRKAAVLAIHAITGHDCGVHPYRAPAASADAIAAAELWWLRRSGARKPD